MYWRLSWEFANEWLLEKSDIFSLPLIWAIFTSKSSIAGVEYHTLVILLFVAHISRQILISCSPLGLITNGYNHWVDSPLTSSVITSFFNCVISYFTLLRKAKVIRYSILHFYFEKQFFWRIKFSLISFRLFFLCVIGFHIINK